MECDKTEPPWKRVAFVSLKGMPLPPFILYQAGWKEAPHKEMHEVKEQITLFNNPEEWELRKKITNPYEAIFSGHEHFPSVSNVDPLSRSYFKMIEMLQILPVPIPNHCTTAHICEGPGGFIQALTDTHTITSIYAMTLRAVKPNIPGWRRSAKYLREHPEIKLEFGVDDTGDILSLQNQRQFVKVCGREAALFTADGGFDFSMDYAKQEQQAFPLLLASFLLGLQTLMEGGTMIIKCFDIYSDIMRDLIVGTATFFTQFTLYKPATSRPCNAERYFIASGYLGYPSAARWIQHLQDAQQRAANLTRLFLCPLPKPLHALLNEQVQDQEALQVQSIYDTLNLDPNDLSKHIARNIQVSRNWCTYFGVPLKSYFQ